MAGAIRSGLRAAARFDAAWSISNAARFSLKIAFLTNMVLEKISLREETSPRHVFFGSVTEIYGELLQAVLAEVGMSDTQLNFMCNEPDQ